MGAAIKPNDRIYARNILKNKGEVKEKFMKCPKCGLLNPDIAQRCDCGYDFLTDTMKEPYEQKPSIKYQQKEGLKMDEYRLFAKINGTGNWILLVGAIIVLFLPLGEWGIDKSFFEYLTVGCILGIFFSISSILRARKLKDTPYLQLSTTRISCLPMAGKEWFVDSDKIENVQISDKKIIFYQRGGGRKFRIFLAPLCENDRMITINWFKKF